MATLNHRTANKASSSSPSTSTTTSASRRSTTPPHLPTPLETAILAIFPSILFFGAVFSVLSPHTRSAPYDAHTQSHSQDPLLAPSYFARKNNIFNVFFVKRGWGWTTFAFLFALATTQAPANGRGTTPRSVVLGRRLRAGLRWALVTAYWFFVTQWFFGPPLIDRSFRLTGGKCEVLGHVRQQGDGEGEAEGTGLAETLFTSVACKAAGGRWKGGHDISGHVFLLVLGTAFLLQEVGWPLVRRSRWRLEERRVVMPSGAVEDVDLGLDEPVDGGGGGRGDGLILSIGGKTAVAVICMNLWMLLMTAIYFHTWVEKFTGLLTAMVGVYTIYHVPRLVPGLRRVVGLPGI